MSPVDLNGLENIKKEVVELLRKRVAEINEELNVNGRIVDTYVGKIVELIDDNRYDDSDEQLAFDRIFFTFERQNRGVFKDLEEPQQKEQRELVKNIFIAVLTPLRENLAELQRLKQQEIKLEEQQRVEQERTKKQEENERKLQELEKKTAAKRKEMAGLKKEAQGLKGRMSGLGGTPMDYPEPETFELAAHFPTILRLAKLHDCNVEDEEDEKTQEERTEEEKKQRKKKSTKNRRENIQENFTEPLNQIKESIRNQDLAILASDQDIIDETQRSLYADIRNRLEGPLAIPATSKLDFNSEESLRNRSYETLALTLRISLVDDNNNKKPIDTIQQDINRRLQEAGVEQQQAAIFMESLRAFIQMRIELNLTESIRLAGKGVESGQATTLPHKSWYVGCRLSGLDPFLQAVL